MKTFDSPFLAKFRRRTAAAALALAALALPAAAEETVTFITGTIDSLAAQGYTDANGRWTWTDGATTPNVSESNGVRRVSFSLGAGQSLEYYPAVECPTNGTAEVVVSNALLHVAAALPATANTNHQASITAAKPAGAETAAYYGWAGAMTNNAPVWFRLAGRTPVEGEEVDVTLSFDYRADPATVSYRVGETTLENATNAEETVFALATAQRKVRYLSFTGQGSIGAMSGTVVVFDTTPPAIEPGEGLVAGDPPAVEATADGFVVRFRTKKAGVTYTLLSADSLSRDATWTPVDDAKATWTSSQAKVEADPNGEPIELAAPIPGSQPVQFYRIQATW